jgi:CheY-like chemotaxis protein
MSEADEVRLRDLHDVLVVDDDPYIREAMVDALQHEGYRVWEAENGQAALKLLEKMPHPCVVLLDMMMPVMDGSTFLSEMRTREAFGSLPVVVLTAQPGPAREDVAHWLRKPFELSDMVDVVRRHCVPLPSAQN